MATVADKIIRTGELRIPAGQPRVELVAQLRSPLVSAGSAGPASTG